ncbi:MAG: CBS domain-containing protein [Bacteroidota bacterium]
MKLKIADLMVKNVVTTQAHKSIGHLRGIMQNNRISSVPVVNSENEPIGIVTSNDLSRPDLNDASPVSTLLSGHVYKVPAYNDISIAAKVMRKHKFHHLLVMHEQELVGIISAFDLLQLLDEHKFVMKNPPTKNKKVNKVY